MTLCKEERRRYLEESVRHHYHCRGRRRGSDDLVLHVFKEKQCHVRAISYICTLWLFVGHLKEESLTQTGSTPLSSAPPGAQESKSKCCSLRTWTRTSSQVSRHFSDRSIGFWHRRDEEKVLSHSACCMLLSVAKWHLRFRGGRLHGHVAPATLAIVCGVKAMSKATGTIGSQQQRFQPMNG